MGSEPGFASLEGIADLSGDLDVVGFQVVSRGEVAVGLLVGSLVAIGEGCSLLESLSVSFCEGAHYF